MHAISRSKAAAIVPLALLVACSGGTTSSLPAIVSPSHVTTASTFRTPAKAPLAVRIRVPKASVVVGRRRSAFVSPSTRGMTIAIAGPRGFHTNVVAGLTPSSPGCVAGAHATTCTLSAGELAACSKRNCYTATIKTYDAVSCTSACTIPRTAHELSAAQNVGFNVAAGTSNNLTFALGGIPQSISLLPLAPGYLKGDASQLRLWGQTSQQLIVTPLDADNNAIVGTGAPTISASSGAGSLVVSNPSAQAPNVVTLHASTSGTPPVVTPGIVNLTLTATPASGTPVRLTVPVTIAHSSVYIGNITVLVGYFDGNVTTPSVSIGGSNTLLTSVIQPIAIDDRGSVYAVNGSTNAIYEFAPGANGNVAPANVITGANTGLNTPTGMAVDSAGTVYVSNNGNSTLTEYPAGSSGNVFPSVTVEGAGSLLVSPLQIALDPVGNIYVANGTARIFTILPAGASGFTDALASINGPATDNSGATQITMLSDGTLCALVTSYLGTGNEAVLEYAPGAYGNAAPARVLTGTATMLDSSSGIAADAAGDLYVADNTTVTEYAPGASGNAAPIATYNPGVGANTFSVAVYPTGTTP